MVQKVPNEPKNVPNGQKHVLLTIWDHLGPFWTTSGLWQACHVRPFLVQMGHFWTPGTLYRCLEMAKKGTSPIALCIRKVLDPKRSRFDNNCGRSIENMVRKGQKGKKISHIMATGSQNRYTMATKDSPVTIFSAKDNLVRFWSHSDMGKYRFYTNSS